MNIISLILVVILLLLISFIRVLWNKKEYYSEWYRILEDTEEAMHCEKEDTSVEKEIDTLVVYENDLQEKVQNACSLGYEVKVELLDEDIEKVFASNINSPIKTYYCYLLHLLKEVNK